MRPLGGSCTRPIVALWCIIPIVLNSCSKGSPASSGPEPSPSTIATTATSVPLCPCPANSVPAGIAVVASGADNSPPPNAHLGDGVYLDCVDTKPRVALSIPLCRQTMRGQRNAYDGVVVIRKSGFSDPKAFVTFTAKNTAPLKCKGTTPFVVSMPMMRVDDEPDTWRTKDSIRNEFGRQRGADYPSTTDFSQCAVDNRYFGDLDVHD